MMGASRLNICGIDMFNSDMLLLIFLHNQSFCVHALFFITEYLLFHTPEFVKKRIITDNGTFKKFERLFLFPTFCFIKKSMPLFFLFFPFGWSLFLSVYCWLKFFSFIISKPVSKRPTMFLRKCVFSFEKIQCNLAGGVYLLSIQMR